MAMIIKRDKYLRLLIDSRENGMVKVVTGLRRCGKSFLLGRIYKKWLKDNGVADDHIININLDNLEYRELRKPESLYAYIKERVVDDSVYYILLDEIQMVPSFEEVLNGFLSWGNADVYVTGSNAKLLSKDVITEFRGRGMEIRMYPLSFSEFFSVFEGSKQSAFNSFMLYGALPQIVTFNSFEQKMSYLSNLMTETYLRDIRERYKIVNDADLDELVNIIASSIGSLTNPSKLSNTFRTVKKSTISYPTVKKYIDYMEDCFLVEKSKRYDIKGRNYIDTPYKYYFTDLGLRNARLGFSQQDPGHLMENIIYNELRIRGFCVDVGMVSVQKRNSEGIKKKMQLEVDFVCYKGSQRYYIQSAYKMLDQDKIKQEMASLSELSDAHKRIVIVGDEIPVQRNENGIVLMGIYDFLLNENSLEF